MITRRHLLLGVGVPTLALLSPAGSAVSDDGITRALQRAARLSKLHGLIIAHEGRVLAEERFRGAPLDRPVNIKSLSKSVIATLTGIAIERGLLSGPEQPIAPLLEAQLPDDADPRLWEITLGHLLSMRAGLERTSGANYGRWVMSGNWSAYALSRPFVDEPGGRMLYSTGNSHLLSAILTTVSGRSTLSLAREWLGEPLGIEIPPWPQDPQGIYFGGNDMLLSPQALLRLGETYRNGGRYAGHAVVPESWIRTSWTARTRSEFTGHGYGYGWFITRLKGVTAYYGWGFGGQMLYVVPARGLTVVMTSDPTTRSSGGYVRELHAIVADALVDAAL